MKIIVPSNQKAFTLEITVKTKRTEQIRIIAKDANKPDTMYMNRKGKVRGTRTFEIKLPTSPDELIVSVYNTKNGNQPLGGDVSFKIVDVRVAPLVEYAIKMTPEDESFYEFALHFAKNAGVLNAGKTKPSTYRSNDGRYTIDYYDVIRDRIEGNELKTPARIGHQTGIIEVSKKDFLKYTIPMRLVILMHEYSHKYKNPKIGRPIDDEAAADINGLYMYLGKGYSEIEAAQAFLYVFRDSNNEMNHKRYKIIRDFTDKFNRGKIEPRRAA